MVLPVIFLLVNCLLFFVYLAPVLDPLISVCRLTFSGTGIGAVIRPKRGDTFGNNDNISGNCLASNSVAFPSCNSRFNRVAIRKASVSASIVFNSSASLLGGNTYVSCCDRVPNYNENILVNTRGGACFRSLRSIRANTLMGLDAACNGFICHMCLAGMVGMSASDSCHTTLGNSGRALVLCAYCPGGALSLAPCHFVTCYRGISKPRIGVCR